MDLDNIAAGNIYRIPSKRLQRVLEQFCNPRLGTNFENATNFGNVYTIQDIPGRGY